MDAYREQVNQLAEAIGTELECRPQVALILGSGLGCLADSLSDRRTIPYNQLPYLPRTTAIGHAGRLVAGKMQGVEVLAMQGRFHLYEGHSPATATLLLRAMHQLGAGYLCVTNAAGGVDPRMQPGDLMIIEDQLNLMFRGPLVGINDSELGHRFADMSAPYDRSLIDAALTSSLREGIANHVGTYVGVLGPSYETRAEYRFFRRIGGSAVGMSTVPEVIVASQLGMKTLGLSLIANVALPDALGTTSGEEVVAVVATAAEKARRLLARVIPTLT